MKSPGNPFRTGTLSNVILFGGMTLIMVYSFLRGGTLNYKDLLFVVVGLAGTAQSYFKYRRLRAQNDLEFIDD